MKLARILAIVAASVASYSTGPALAQAAGPGQAAPRAPAAAPPSIDGEVRKIDKAQAKVTLKHGPIANLEMPAMTMVFRVADPKMLDSLKEGDKVKFAAANVNGALTVTSIAK
jgi:Cu/Ag efflux protein CusF